MSNLWGRGNGIPMSTDERSPMIDIPWQFPYHALGAATDLIKHSLMKNIFYDKSITVPPFNTPQAGEHCAVDVASLFADVTNPLVSRNEYFRRNRDSHVAKLTRDVGSYRRKGSGTGSTQVPAVDRAWEAMREVDLITSELNQLRDRTGDPTVIPTLGWNTDESPHQPPFGHSSANAVNQMIQNLRNHIDENVFWDIITRWVAKQWLPVEMEPDRDCLDAMQAPIFAEEWGPLEEIVTNWLEIQRPDVQPVNLGGPYR